MSNSKQTVSKTKMWIYGGFLGLCGVFGIGCFIYWGTMANRYLVPGINYYNSGQYDAAIPDLIKFNQYGVGGMGYYYLGLCREKKGQFQLARYDFNIAIKQFSGGKNPNPDLVNQCRQEIAKIDKAQ